MSEAVAAPLALLLALGPLAEAAPPDVGLAFPSLVETVPPGREQSFFGDVVVTFPEDADCSEDVVVHLRLAERPANATTTLLPENVTIPADRIDPGRTERESFEVRIRPDDDATAYDFLVVLLHARTDPCGTLNATQRLVQLAPRVAFVPALQVQSEEETVGTWRFNVTTLANGPMRVDWKLLQPAQGRVLDAGSVRLDRDAANRTQAVTADTSHLAPDEPVLFNATLSYAGPAAVAAPPGFIDVTFTSSLGPARGMDPTVWWVLLVVTVAALGAFLWWRRRRP